MTSSRLLHNSRCSKSRGALALLRTGEAEYAQLGLDDPTVTDDRVIAAMAEHPRLIERPVFVHEGRAVIARPPERVLELLRPDA